MKHLREAIPILFGVLAVVALGGWYYVANRLAPQAKVENADPGNDPPKFESAVTPEYLVVGPGEPATGELAALQFVAYRGPRGDADYTNGLEYELDWDNHPPKELWHLELGEGHSGFAVRDGKVYIQDYDIYNRFVLFRSDEDLADFSKFVENLAFGDEELAVVGKLFAEDKKSDLKTPAEMAELSPAERQVAEEARKDFDARLERIQKNLKKFDREKALPEVADIPAFLDPGCRRGWRYHYKYHKEVTWVTRLWTERGGRKVDYVYGYQDMVRCHSLADGAEIWRNSYYVDHRPNEGLTRGTPSVTADRVVALGPQGLLMCLEADTGKRRWAKDIVGEFGSKIPPWWGAQSPLIVDDPVVPGRRLVLFAPSGTQGGQRPNLLIVALDLKDGAFIWSTPNPAGWELSHATPLLVEFDGMRCVLYCAHGGVTCVKLKGGRPLWNTDLWKVGTATVTAPVDCGQGRFFFSGGYKSGAKMLQATKGPDGEYVVEELWKMPPTAEGYECEQHGPILRDGFMYGVNSSDQSRAVVCIDPNTGKLRWTSKTDHTFYLAPYFLHGDHLWVLQDEGEQVAREKYVNYKGQRRNRPVHEATPLVVFKVGPDKWDKVIETKVTRGRNAYAMMTLVGDRLLLRDSTYMQCLQLRAKATEREEEP